jgi:hypothetical protein
MSSVGWDTCEEEDAAMGKDRTYRLLEAYRGGLAREFNAEVKALLEDSAQWDCIPRHCRTHMETSVAAAMLLKSVAGVHHHITSVYQGYPYKLWVLMDLVVPRCQAVDAVYADMSKEPPCLLDEISLDFCCRFNTKEKLGGDEARSVLQSLAVVVRLDTARVECSHAWLRRLLQIKGQTWVQEFLQCSADWLLAHNRLIEGLPNKKQASKKTETSSRGGGGAYRAFFSEWANTNRLSDYEDRRAWMKASHDEYKLVVAAGGERLAELQELGRVGTAAHRVGGRAFDNGHLQVHSGASGPAVAGNTELALLGEASVNDLFKEHGWKWFGMQSIRVACAHLSFSRCQIRFLRLCLIDGAACAARHEQLQQAVHHSVRHDR